MTMVLFDVDGTLLHMDQDVFVKDYFSRFARNPCYCKPNLVCYQQILKECSLKPEE